MSALVLRARERWLDDPYPMLVEHRVGAAEHICPAPSLWMGGRAVAERLRASGLGPGHRVRHAGDSAIAFVQCLVGCLRAGVTLVTADDPAAGIVHARVLDDLTVALDAPDAPRSSPDARVCGRLGDTGSLAWLDAAAVDAMALAAAAMYDPARVRVEARGAWRDALWLAVDVLGPLWAGAEIHRGGGDDGAWRQRADAWPEVITAADAARVRDAAPRLRSAVVARDAAFDGPDGVALCRVHLDDGARLQVSREAPQAFTSTSATR